MLQSGVYAIEHTASHRLYIGSAVNLGRRLYEHRRLLRNGVHANRRLQRAWTKYGEVAFSFHPIERAPMDELLKREQVYLNYGFRSKNGLYNTCHTAGNTSGRLASSETRKRISAALAGKLLSPEHRAKIAKAGLGRVVSPATCAKHSAAMKGKPKSAEHRAALSKAATRREALKRKDRQAKVWAAHSAWMMGNQYARKKARP